MGLVLFVLYICFTIAVVSRGEKLIVWEVGSGLYMLFSLFFGFGALATIVLLFVILVEFFLRSSRVQNMLFDKLYIIAKSSIPKLTKTEEEALNAGSVWFEASIFKGDPDFEALAKVKSELSLEEQSFLDKETATLCAMLDNWQVSQMHDLPKSAWNYIKTKGFLGLVIDKAYGGKGFSAKAHSEIVQKIASRCPAAAVTVMVPNSLGPGELLQHYGTEEQKAYYLPRLAVGEEIPCFALTEPGAGSDATAIQSTAVVIEHNVDGKPTLWLELSLNKRWITLAPIATLIGLAVQLRDPSGLLQGVGSEGITCLLISRDTPNLEIGNRHLPAQESFMNGTIRGKHIIVSIDSIIGGQKMAGQGWPMLVECLSVGRSISLPALGAASSSVAYLMTGAYAVLRRQFNVGLADFEGIQERLAEIAGLSYLIQATRLLTLASVDAGGKPSVASAITKYANTELARIVMNHAMDIHGGRGVVIGPRNYLANFYQSIPITTTVEGANIMTRNLLIFGQGAMACHPYLKQEFYALSKDDRATFQSLIWQHMGYFLKNLAKSVGAAWTGGFLISVENKPLKRTYQKLSRLSYAYAWLADLSLMMLGGALKRRERLSARLADAMIYLYLAMAALQELDRQGQSKDAELHALWATEYCFYHAQQAMLGVCREFPNLALKVVLRCGLFPWGASMQRPSDALDAKLARLMTTHNSYREVLKKWIYLGGNPSDPLDRMEQAFEFYENHAHVFPKIRTLKYCNLDDLESKLNEMIRLGSLTEEEKNILTHMEQCRWDAIQVDEFTAAEIQKSAHVMTPYGSNQQDLGETMSSIKEEA